MNEKNVKWRKWNTQFYTVCLWELLSYHFITVLEPEFITVPVPTFWQVTVPIPLLRGKKLGFLWFRFRFRFPQHWNRYCWSVRARCIPAAVCVVRLDVARIDESPGWLVTPATRVFELGQVYPLQLWVTLPTQKLITSVSWNYFWLLSKKKTRVRDFSRWSYNYFFLT